MEKNIVPTFTVVDWGRRGSDSQTVREIQWEASGKWKALVYFLQRWSLFCSWPRRRESVWSMTEAECNISHPLLCSRSEMDIKKKRLSQSSDVRENTMITFLSQLFYSLSLSVCLPLALPRPLSIHWAARAQFCASLWIFWDPQSTRLQTNDLTLQWSAETQTTRKQNASPRTLEQLPIVYTLTNTSNIYWP